jgi:hypothetical protein
MTNFGRRRQLKLAIRILAILILFGCQPEIATPTPSFDATTNSGTSPSDADEIPESQAPGEAHQEATKVPPEPPVTMNPIPAPSPPPETTTPPKPAVPTPGSIVFQDTGTWTVPALVTSVTIEIWGSGGAFGPGGGGGGGGGGGYAKKILATTPGMSIAFTVGTTNGATTCGDMVADKGADGLPGNFRFTRCTGGQGGAPGQASGGDINLQGTAGSPGPTENARCNTLPAGEGGKSPQSERSKAADAEPSPPGMGGGVKSPAGKGQVKFSW